MKFISVILSIYVMALTFVPCTDGHIHEDISESVTLIQQDHEQNQSSNDVDLCSPFCFCACCQSNSQTSNYIIPKVYMPGVKVIIAMLAQSEIESTILFWRPPKA